MSAAPETDPALLSADGRRHFLVLDSLRGCCACIVALYHLQSATVLQRLGFVFNGFLFVDFFFVLSGFVIMQSYGEKLRGGMAVSRFMGLRLGRIYPVHGAVLTALFLMQLTFWVRLWNASADPQHTLRGFVQAVLLLQAFTHDGVGNWNPASWSISAEFWTYLAFAIACRLAPRHLGWVLIAVVLLSPIAMESATDRHINACFAGSLWRCFFGFGIGALCSIFWARYGTRVGGLSASAATAWEIVLTVACGAAVDLAGAGPYSYLCPLIFAVAILVFAAEGGAISRLLKTRPALLLGTLSYSIYMVHETVFSLTDKLLAAAKWHPPMVAGRSAQPLGAWTNADFASSIVYTGAVMAAVIGFALLSFRFVEDPGRLWSRRLMGAQKAAPVQPIRD